MPSRRAKSRGGFTLVELLIVVAIIGLLLDIFMPTLGMFTRYLQRMRCQINLSNCQKIMFQYAANNGTMLPPFSGSNHMEVIETRDSNQTMFRELKRYGAKASVFTCPAYPGYEDNSDYKWNSWDKARSVNVGGTPMYTMYTGGYVFFTGNGRLFDTFRDGRQFADSNDTPGNPPFAADMLRFDPGTAYGDIWKGWYHMEDSSLDEPGGGGNTIFLSGAVAWWDWEELEGGVDDDPPTQPAWNGAQNWPWYYFCGLRPRTD